MKKIKVEKLLSWAFLHELSKGGGANGLNSGLSAWGRMEGVISLGVRIDLNRARQDLPEQFEQGAPHPDAVIIGQAVRDLAKHDFGNLDVPFDALPLASWSDEAKEIAKPIFQTVVEKPFTHCPCYFMRCKRNKTSYSSNKAQSRKTMHEWVSMLVC